MDQQLVINNYEYFLTDILPLFLNNITCKSPDTRFNSLRFTSDIILNLINEEEVYSNDYKTSKNNKSTILINAIIKEKLLTKYFDILKD
jgi:hypothetical protein